MNHQALVGSPRGWGRGAGRGAAGTAIQGSQSEAQWESAIHLPNVTTLSISTTRMKMIAVLGRKKVTHIRFLGSYPECFEMEALC